MKNFLFLLLFIFVTPAIAETPPQVTDYKTYLATLDGYSPDRIKFAEQQLKTTYKNEVATTRDELFAEFLAFYRTYINTLEEHAIQEDLLRRCDEDGDVAKDCEERLARLKKSHNLSIIVNDNPGRHIDLDIEKELRKFSIALGFCEEASVSFKEKGNYILITFGDFVSPIMKQFLELRDLEINKSIVAGCEGFPDYEIGPAEYRARKKALDRFIIDNIHFKLITNVEEYRTVYKNSYTEYLTTVARTN